jgi:starch-binding outer membrane protein SusE/F
MKNINKMLIAFLSIVAVSCTDKDIQDNRQPIVAATTPVLLTPKSDFNILLSKANENQVATTIIWNDAAYQGSTTVVNYAIEIAKAGTDFKSPTTVTTTTNRFKEITVGELNVAMVNGGFIEKAENAVDIRIKSTVGTNGGVPQVSNSYTIKATPYHTPLASSLWLVGAATPGGWSWDGDAETEFPLVKGKTDVYEVSMVLKNNETFRIFLGNNFTSSGNWDKSNNFPFYSGNGYTITPDLVNAGDGDSNFRYVGTTGARVFKIDTTAKTITLY